MKKTRTVMEERIIEEWECDMCGVVNKAGTATLLVATPHPGINARNFADLCEPCRNQVVDFIVRHRKLIAGWEKKK